MKSKTKPQNPTWSKDLLERFEQARQLQRSRKRGAQEQRFRLMNGHPVGSITADQYQKMLKGEYTPWPI